MSTPAEVSVTPLGREPDSVNVGAGSPLAVTVNDPDVPAVKVVLGWLVMAGAWSTVRVNDWVASGETPLLAIKTIE